MDITTKDKPIFSIIIPTYNRAGELDQCLESLQMQTFRSFEVLVCDDGSTDGSRQVVEKWASQGLNVRYFFEKNWGGPARPRNKGIAAAAGEWICFLDADDWWAPSKLEEARSNLDHGDIIYHDLIIMTTNGKRVGRIRSRRITKPAFADLMIRSNAIANSSVCIKKELLVAVGGVTENRALIGVEDSDLWLKVSRISDRFHFIPKALGYYRVGIDSLTEVNQVQINRIKVLIASHIDYLSEKSQRREVLLTLKYLTGRIKFAMGKYDHAAKDFKYGVKSSVQAIRLRAILFLVRSWLKSIIHRS